MDDRHSAEVQCQIQMSGLLAKRPVGHEASKWSRRLVNKLAIWTKYDIYESLFTKQYGSNNILER